MCHFRLISSIIIAIRNITVCEVHILNSHCWSILIKNVNTGTLCRFSLHLDSLALCLLLQLLYDGVVQLTLDHAHVL